MTEESEKQKKIEKEEEPDRKRKKVYRVTTSELQRAVSQDTAIRLRGIDEENPATSDDICQTIERTLRNGYDIEIRMLGDGAWKMYKKKISAVEVRS